MKSHAKSNAAFTLVELLVVIGIIALLVGILVPTVSRVRESAQAASTASLIQQLAGAAEVYAADLGGFPGPIPNSRLGNPLLVSGSPSAVQIAVDAPSAFASTIPAAGQGITGTENLVLGLLGGLANAPVSTSPTGPNVLHYDPSTVGQGPLALRGSALDKRNNPYFSPQATDLSWRIDGTARTGRYLDVANNAANDTIIPEFVDRFADPLPILYLRANKGEAASVAVGPGGAQYTVNQVGGYTASGITVGGEQPSDAPNANHGLQALTNNGGGNDRDGERTFGFEVYFTNPDVPNQPRQKDGFILISAGRDRIYGTRDDITNFGGI